MTALTMRSLLMSVCMNNRISNRINLLSSAPAEFYEFNVQVLLQTSSDRVCSTVTDDGMSAVNKDYCVSFSILVYI